MRLVIALIRDGLPLSPSATRAVAATLLDWRFELAEARSHAERLLVQVTYTLALCRAVVCSAFVESPGEVGSPFVLRVVTSVAGLVAILMLATPVPLTAEPVPFVSLVFYRLASALPTLVAWLPALVFLAEVTGRRERRGATMGGLVGVAVLVLGGVFLLDVAVAYRSWADLDLFAARACFVEAPGDLPSNADCIRRLGARAERGFGTPWTRSVDMWVSLTLITCSLAVLGRRIREAGSVHGWVVGLAPLYVVAASLPLLLALVIDLPMRMFLGITFAWLPEFGLVGVFAASVLWAAICVRRQAMRAT